MSYWQTVMSEKSWAWSIVALVWFVVMLIVRHLLLRYIFVQLKKMNKEIRDQIQRNYLPRSIVGWLLFFLGITLGTLICLDPGFAERYLTLFQLQVLCIGILGSSIFVHTHAYTSALLKVLTEQFGVEKTS